MHAESERRAACCELISEVARNAGQVRLKLTGTSMLPAMWPGDVVTVSRCQLAELNPGQVVLFHSQGGLTAHRVIRTYADRVLTQGDSVPHCDNSVHESAVIGYVSSIVRDQRTIKTTQTLRNRMLAALLRRSHLCLRITLRLGLRSTSHTQPSLPEAA